VLERVRNFINFIVKYANKIFYIFFKDILPTSTNTLSVMKHEYVHRYKLSNNLIEDLETTKLFCDNLCLPNQGEIEGYIRSIRLDPFGFVLISDIQVIL
jgi:hypothetical protein